jgi:Lrp/AsnC family transcriptional regulator, regulator for asnA, asnC and gidA
VSILGDPLDEIDAQIVEQLQTDGRMPYTKLGTAVGLSEAAVRQRVQRLINAGAVQIVAVTDPLSRGLRRAAMIGITVRGDLRATADLISEFPEVTYLVITAGSYDLLAEVVVSDDEVLLDLVNDRIRNLPGVRRTETFVYLKLAKQTFAYGARDRSAR